MTVGQGRPQARYVRAWLLAALALTIPTLTACFVAVREPAHNTRAFYAGEQVYITEAPPPPRSDVVVGVAPSRSHVWVENRWMRQHDDWSWGGGRWEARPHSSAVWVNGSWDHRPRGYVWVGGYWH